jgi:flagellar export protein FliJ
MESRKLKRMLELKRRIEQARKGDVAGARKEVDQAEASLRRAQSEQRARAAALAEESDLSLSELMERARFVELAGQLLVTARDALAERHQNLAQHEEAMILATRDVRTFEILNERDREQQRTVARKVEQLTSDDIVSSRSRRSKV